MPDMIEVYKKARLEDDKPVTMRELDADPDLLLKTLYSIAVLVDMAGSVLSSLKRAEPYHEAAWLIAQAATRLETTIPKKETG